MNLVNAVITKVISGVYQSYNKFWVKVEYNCYGRISETSLMFSDYEEALNVKEGDEINV